MKEQAIQEKIDKYDEMAKKLQTAQAQCENNAAANHILTDMINKGQASMDENGNVTIIKQNNQEE